MSQRLHVVLKSPEGLGNAWAVLGVFSTDNLATGQCKGPGAYLVVPVEIDVVYPGCVQLSARLIDVKAGLLL